MKNKHLVLLFLAVVAIGLVTRWVPLKYRSVFANNLLWVDTTQLSKIQIFVPGQSELVLERLDAGWTAEQAGRTCPVVFTEIQGMFRLLNGVRAYQTIHSKRPDTLGIDSSKVLRLQLVHRKGVVEKLEIGAEREKATGPVSYLRLPNHDGIYEVPGRFRTVFLKNLNDFRSNKVLQIDLELVQKIGIRLKEAPPMYLNRNDSLGRWFNANGQNSFSADSVMQWLNLFQQLEHCGFADHFDETREQERLYSTITLGHTSGQYFTLRFFYQRPPDLPEDLSRLSRKGISSLPSYVFHSSQNPRNYFALTDTLLARNLCRGLLPADDLNTPEKRQF